MKTKILISVLAMSVSVLAFAGDASAANGRKKSLLTGAAVGVVAGAGAAYLLGKAGAQAQQPVQAEPRYTGSIRPARYQSDEEECSVRNIDLFDRKGNFVKKERMRVCE